MKLENQLETTSDDTLLERLKLLIQRQNAITAALLAHIAEVDRRNLYLREACSSMHRYCVERLGLSDGAAYKRIHAARVAVRFPMLFGMIERGEIHLKGITLLATHLTESNHHELLARARDQPVRAIEKLVAEIAPRPDVPSRVRALPQRPPKAPVETAELQSCLRTPRNGPSEGGDVRDRAQAGRGGERPMPEIEAEAAVVDGPVAHPPRRTSEPSRRAIAPLAPRRYELRVTIDEDTRADLEQLQGLLGHQIPGGDPAEILRRALALLLDRTLARKASLTNEPRGGQRAGSPAKRSRYIPAEVRRTVWLRDEGRCAFVDRSGNRCTSRSKLEFHHLDNWARGADHTTDRLELRCQAHNLFQATLDYGEAFMHAAKSRRSGAREAPSAYAP